MKTKIGILVGFMFLGALLPKKCFEFLIRMGFDDPHFHMMALATITAICLWIFRQSVTLTFAFVVFFAFATEISQSLLTTTRHFNWEDIRDDLIGSCITLTLFGLWKVKDLVLPIVMRKSNKRFRKLILSRQYLIGQWQEFTGNFKRGKSILLRFPIFFIHRIR